MEEGQQNAGNLMSPMKVCSGRTAQTPCVGYSYSRYSYLSSPWDNKCPGGYRLKQQTLVKTSNNLRNGNTGHLHPSDNKCPGGYMWLQDVLR